MDSSLLAYYNSQYPPSQPNGQISLPWDRWGCFFSLQLPESPNRQVSSAPRALGTLFVCSLQLPESPTQQVRSAPRASSFFGGCPFWGTTTPKIPWPAWPNQIPIPWHSSLIALRLPASPSQQVSSAPRAWKGCSFSLSLDYKSQNPLASVPPAPLSQHGDIPFWTTVPRIPSPAEAKSALRHSLVQNVRGGLRIMALIFQAGGSVFL